jgi:ankyrin repeat protein
MYAAARNGHTRVADYLLDRGADVDAKGIFGATALHWAAFYGHGAPSGCWSTAARAARSATRGSTPPPAGWAAEGGHPDLADRLRVGGAQA